MFEFISVYLMTIFIVSKRKQGNEMNFIGLKTAEHDDFSIDDIEIATTIEGYTLSVVKLICS